MFIVPLGHAALLAIPLVSSLFVSGVAALPSSNLDTRARPFVARGDADSDPLPSATLPPSEEVLTPRIYTSCTANNTVAVSFDDGPYLYTKEIVDTLNKAGAKGTFFVNGNNYRCIYDDDMIDNLKYAYKSGHMVASHTWDHSDLTTLSWDKLHNQFWRVELALQRILGVKPAFMRPPFGAHNEMVDAVALARNQSMAIWDFDSGDASGEAPEDSINGLKETARLNPANVMPLEHETQVDSVRQVLPVVLDLFKGYKFVTIAECVGRQPYQSVAAPQTKTADWNCSS